ncbi:hypothetical protein GTCCBUS3UF5_15580 [Geobacillus thermoleovorans CCB_US3_UF5]|uniref:Uncharacterized protein n=1 Tax=Geobacillus thermoleovorans CCB_US3_UF5 TaxID=1111068 RepID=A0ABN4A032_GEOTH|nr:hypothetical protein GTCCBUS3UF5_15580 [Geobacillus thermoleovorans CCB_US3_UF5]GAJ59315.1 hypothetical protein B23_2540 [Geobacillus thermoleovorans B23]
MHLHVECLKYILLYDDFTIHYRGWPRQAKERKFPKKLFAGPKNNALKRKTGRWGRK